jgi:riboflavin synthase
MFSGIVEEVGRVRRNGIAVDGRLVIDAAGVAGRVQVGDSVAVDGCCLTVVEAGNDGFTVDVMPETARRTALGDLRDGDPVNLETALRLGEPVGGHLVSGHVDARGAVAEVRDEGNARWLSIRAPEEVIRYLVPRGCVAVDGISLTVVEVDDDRFTVSLVPHTLEGTTAGEWRVGETVNLEADLLAKYVERSVDVHLSAGTTVGGP